jgi:uncharacterized repeat protein (TIGR01451 family)
MYMLLLRSVKTLARPQGRSWLAILTFVFVALAGLAALAVTLPAPAYAAEPAPDPAQLAAGPPAASLPEATTAGVTILNPPDGTTAKADPCPVAPCTAKFRFDVEVTGLPMDYVRMTLTPDVGQEIEATLCTPPNPIEPHIHGCPDPPVVLTDTIGLAPANWTVVAHVTRGAQVEDSSAVHLTVQAPDVVAPGPVALSSVDPLQGAPPIQVRDPGPEFSKGISTTADIVTIWGTNLDNNDWLRVYAAPIPVNEPSLTEDSGLPTANWCLFEAEILSSGTSDGKSFLQVRVPQIPLETPSLCGISPGPSGSSFAQDWRWLIRDPWIRPERVHEWWAIPSPRTVAWHDAPPFRMVKPTYPRIDGFGFENKETDPKYYEFLTVYDTNAYLCVGAAGVCATYLPDPLYHILWWPIYYGAVGSTGGTCNGMASTSLLMAREELQPEAFDPAVHYPRGFADAGDPATYKDTNWCTPVCSPPQPDNLWANIRMNHGVQISREFLFEILDTLGEAIFDPNDLTTIKGVPNATLARVAAAPQSYVICFFDFGSGHCVTPYRVDGNKIMIYDNNAPNNDQRYIEIVGGDYNYPARTKEPNQGNAIMAFPIDIWKSGRHLLGLKELNVLVNGDVVEFLYMIAVGSGDMTVTNDAGGRWGWEDDGTFTDSMFGAFSIAPLGPPDVAQQAMPLLVAMNQPAPTVQINADGGRYLYQTGAGGHLFQLEAQASSGDKDQVQLGYAGGDLDSFDFTPQRSTSAFVPRVGLAIGEEESALFHWLGLDVPGGQRMGFGADKQARAVTFRNDTSGAAHYLLALDYGSGAANSAGRMVYGPFQVPEGASQRVVLAAWPDVTAVEVELDLDRDGTPDSTETVTGHVAPPPLDPGASADLSVVKTFDPKAVSAGEAISYTVTVANAGPDDATDVTLVDLLPSGAGFTAVETTQGTCDNNASGLSCQLGDLPAGETAVVTYVATPGSPANLATVSGSQGDPDLTNNSALATTKTVYLYLPTILR